MSTEMFTNNRVYVLSIAGLDPSAGAGLLADVKTIEALGCYGLAVNTANTIQNDLRFEACHWIQEDFVVQQLNLLLDRFPVEVVKIGIIENLQVLKKVIEQLLLRNKDIRIIWDPVLKSSSGFSFQDTADFQVNFEAILEKIFLVTPNLDELKMFYPGSGMEETVQKMRSKTNLYLKGGHRTENKGLDELFTTQGDSFSFEAQREDCSEKHGSGCVLSSAVVAYLALNYSLPEAGRKAKKYAENFLASNKTLLGYHNL